MHYMRSTPPTLVITLLLEALLAACTTYLEALLFYCGAVADGSTGVVAGEARETSAGMAGIAGGERETRSERYSTVLHYYFTTTKVQIQKYKY